MPTPTLPRMIIPITKSIYVAGPMRGYADHNFPAFVEARHRLTARGWLFVVTPPDVCKFDFAGVMTYAPADYLRRDIWHLTRSGAIALLPGWRASTGARCEVAIAITLGLPFYDAETCERIETPAAVTINGGYERAPGEPDSIERFLDDVREWRATTFPHSTPHSCAKHLLKEANELVANPTDTKEAADILMLLSGLQDNTTLLAAGRAKLEECKTRQWGAPDADGVVEHIREESPA